MLYELSRLSSRGPMPQILLNGVIGQTLWKDYSKDEAPLLIREMVDDLALRLRNEEKLTSVVSLFIMYSKNQGGFARQMSLLGATDNTNTLLEAIMEIYNMYIKDIPIRGIHIYFGKLTNRKAQQLNIFEDTEKQVKDHNLQLAMDKLHNKYGKNILLRASALTDYSTARERHEFIGGHKR